MLIEMAKIRIPEKWEEDEPSPEIKRLEAELKTIKNERDSLQEKVEMLESKLQSGDAAHMEERRRMTEERENLTQAVVNLTAANAIERESLTSAIDRLSNVTKMQQEQLTRSTQLMLEADNSKIPKKRTKNGWFRRLLNREERIVDASHQQANAEKSEDANHKEYDA